MACKPPLEDSAWMDCVPKLTGSHALWRLSRLFPSIPATLTSSRLNCQTWGNVLLRIAEEPEGGRAWGLPEEVEV